MKKREMFNTILVHVSRTWERIRLQQKFKEMPLDNIESVDAIIQISDEIMANKVIKGFLNAKDKNDFFMRKTDMLSDTYIETVAEEIIFKNYLEN